MPRFPRMPLPAAAMVLLVLGAVTGRPAGGAVRPGRPDGPLAPDALRSATVRLMEFGPRPVGAEGHGPAASYVGGRFVFGGLKPVLTDTFACPVLSDRQPEGGPPSDPAACGSVVAFGHALPLADAWSLMKGEAEAFTFARPPRPDLEAALEQAARDEGVARLTPFDVFKRPSPLFPRAVVRCLLRRLVRREAGTDADAPSARGRAMADMLRRLARAHEAVLVTAPLDMRPAPKAGAHGADESASLTVLTALAVHLVSESPRPRRRTLLCAALDGHWRRAAGARSLARMLEGRASRVAWPRSPGGEISAAAAGTRRAERDAETRPASEEAAGEPSEDAQLAALLGPSEAAARAPALAEALAARPTDAALLAEAEDVLVRLLRVEPYRVRLVICLDLSSGGRTLAVHVADAHGGGRGALRAWLAERVQRVRAKCKGNGPAGFPGGMPPMPDTASGRACTALAAAARPAVLLRTADAPRDRWFTAADTAARMDVAALADQARAVAALVEEILAAEDLPFGE